MHPDLLCLLIVIIIVISVHLSLVAIVWSHIYKYYVSMSLKQSQSAEKIRCVFDDNSKIIFVKSSYIPMLWVLIRIASAEAILMSTHNIGFYEEISSYHLIIIKYHQISSNTHLISSAAQFILCYHA